MLALRMAPALAVTINVRGSCTLSSAITSANNDIAVAGCTRGRGADRIVLPPRSPVSLREANNRVYGPTGLPVIRSQITIAGNGSTIRRVQSAPNFRILAVGDTGDLTLQRTVAVAYF
jgi:hypothetical protein